MNLKDLRRELSESGIYNEINPTHAQIEAGKFDFKKLFVPIALMFVGLLLQYFVKDLSRSYQLIPVIPEAIAGWLLYDIAAERVSWVKDMRRGRIGFMAVVIVLVGLLGEFLF